MNGLKWAFAWLFSLVLFFPASALAQYFPGFSYGQSAQDYEALLLEQRIKEHLIALLLGAMVGAFFSERLKKFRFWLVIGCILLVLLAGVYLNKTLGNVAFFFGGAAGAYIALRDKIMRERRRRAAKPTTFGSAQWADLEHLQRNGLVGEQGFLLGAFETFEAAHPLRYAGDRHLLTIAPTRSGKGVSSIIPNLLLYEGSAIVIDPKGENARITAFRRGNGDTKQNIPGLGQKVHVVDPWGITGLPASRFNPMDWLDPKDEDINENAMMLADSIVVPRQGSSEPFWDEEAKALLMGLLLYVALDEREREDRTLGRVRDIISMGNDALKDVLLQMVENENPIICSTAERTISKEEKLRNNVLASLQSHTHFLDSPRIRASLHASDFCFEDLKKEPMTVYLVLPADRLDTFGRWLRLLVQQALTVNARNIEVKPERPILFLLDEMASLGHLTMVEQAYGLMAGFGMQLWGIVQDLSQLERVYEKGWETFIGNSGVLQYFGSRDHKTAEYFSKLCGVTTIQKISFGASIARAFGRSSSSSSGGQGAGSSTSGTSSSVTYSDSATYDLAQRHLAYPDELMVLRDEKQLLMIENCNPIPGKKISWYKDPVLKPLGVNLHEQRPFVLKEPPTLGTEDPVLVLLNEHIDNSSPPPTMDQTAPLGAQKKSYSGIGRPALIKKPTRKSFPKVGRNDPCSCGSGKKYKKCCGQEA